MALSDSLMEDKELILQEMLYFNDTEVQDDDWVGGCLTHGLENNFLYYGNVFS